jgi:tRNA(Ile)-lysidine synthase
VRRARELGFHVETSRATTGLAATEAAWRVARWAFLARVARGHGGAVVTAHTRDDLLETIVMRLLRGSGARGLAAMLAPSSGGAVTIRRPFLEISRDQVAAWAGAHGVSWVDDPANASPRYLRVRVRRDLLPAMERAHPGVGDALLDLAHRAADVRATLDACAASLSTMADDRTLVIAASALDGYDADALAALWPAFAARLGLALDRRGTSRAAEFTIRSRPGGTVQLSGGFELARRRDVHGRDGRADLFVLGRTRRTLPASVADAADERRLVPGVRIGGWSFRLLAGTAGETAGTDGIVGDGWVAELPADLPLAVRAWRPGDRMRAQANGTARRVKRFFADARVPGMDRAGWPVVLAAGEIVWIPGVRRAIAATDRSGRPGVRYLCERISD